MNSLLLTCTAALALSACGSTHKVPSRIGADLLRQVPEARLKPVAEALEASTVARIAYRNARERTRTSSRAVGLALEELEVVTNRLGAARVAVASAKRAGSGPALDRAEAQYKEFLGVARIARLGISLARREHELAALRERLALEESRLADAHVELARAVAVSGLDVPAEQSVPLDDMRDAVQFYGREVAIADRRLSAGRVRMTQARADYEAAIAGASHPMGTLAPKSGH